jgi:hypothetical protein
MIVDVLNLQMAGIDIADLKQDHILDLIEKDLKTKEVVLPEDEKIRIYVNLEGTAVTAYYICSECKGAVSLSLG